METRLTTEFRRQNRLDCLTRVVAGLAFVATACLGIGCATDDSGIMHESFRIFRPRESDYRDETQEVDEEWDSVGKAARSDRPLENEHDPLKELFMSPKAKSIERSLGYE